MTHYRMKINSLKPSNMTQLSLKHDNLSVPPKCRDVCSGRTAITQSFVYSLILFC